ncbi:MAG: hypothetical protein CSA86_03860 [Arcobacter sp.]|nr:MAG: hypothetical protein CSA86_03860 [Arcobacter sp.]
MKIKPIRDNLDKYLKKQFGTEVQKSKPISQNPREEQGCIYNYSRFLVLHSYIYTLKRYLFL